MWWAYRHVNGTFHWKRYFGPEDTEEARESPFVAEIYGPWPVDSRKEASDMLGKELAKSAEAYFIKTIGESSYDLANHIVVMADDAYLSGHPEWEAIVEEARALLEQKKS